MLAAWIIGAAILALALYAGVVERKRLRVRTLRLATGQTSRRIVHFSDLHYKGDRRSLARVVERIDALRPDFVCFTGDIVEDLEFLPEALELMGKIRAPMFGVPGNHDRRTGATARAEVAERFASRGGAWLSDREVEIFDGEIAILGVAAEDLAAYSAGPGDRERAQPTPKAGSEANRDREAGSAADADPADRDGRRPRRILLCHYPVAADAARNGRYDLILAGHTHGGQIRLPFLGAPVLPPASGRYDRWMFETPAGPMHVSAGIGAYLLPLRFCCPPEITLIEW